jgi:hypothetical protein
MSSYVPSLALLERINDRMEKQLEKCWNHKMYRDAPKTYGKKPDGTFGLLSKGKYIKEEEYQVDEDANKLLPPTVEEESSKQQDTRCSFLNEAFKVWFEAFSKLNPDVEMDEPENGQEQCYFSWRVEVKGELPSVPVMKEKHLKKFQKNWKEYLEKYPYYAEESDEEDSEEEDSDEEE